MIRKIIKIDSGKCNGCGICVNACKEGAIAIVEGKARLMREDYCDGLGNCLPECPTGAITFEEREAAAFDKAAVKAEQNKASTPKAPFVCPGTRIKSINRRQEEAKLDDAAGEGQAVSQLRQWPVELKLVPPNAPYFENANLLIAADCTAYAYGAFHSRFMKNKITLIGCPKLDAVDYAEKLTAIFGMNNIKSVTIVRMEVPCCGGIVKAVTDALSESGRMIPWSVVTISTDGKILED